jgi:hypothetical protein
MIIAIYLAAYQYGFLATIWEPFFGNGSRLVLGSGLFDGLSRALDVPLHDAALGVVAYLVEACLAWAGTRRRAAGAWEELAYGGVVTLMGVTSFVLVLLQATYFHSWCTLCLASAVISGAIVLVSRDDLARAAGILIHGRKLGWHRFGWRAR